jgi:hypothetical protein
MSKILVIISAGPKKPLKMRSFLSFDLILVLKTQTYHLGFKRLSRTVAQLLIVVDPLLGSFFLYKLFISFFLFFMGVETPANHLGPKSPGPLPIYL